jgi:hydroxyacylglutathione hydrolase
MEEIMIEEIYKDVFKIIGDSNIYFLREENILIDAGNFSDDAMIKEELSKVTSLEKIKTVIFTHLHYDHIGNCHLFPAASFYASKDAISCLKENKSNTILSKPLADNFNISLKDIESLKLPDYLEVIYTPGHSKDSLCVFDKKRKILFSGDTLFFNGNVGRYDLPFSSKEELLFSLKKLKELDYEILAPGHDY